MVAKQTPCTGGLNILRSCCCTGLALMRLENTFPLIVIEVKIKKREELLVISRKTFRTIKKQDSHQRRVVY